MADRDISTRDDLEQVLRRFYRAAMQDELIGYLFTEVARLDLEAHLPVITDFWESVLFHRLVYRGNPMRVHHALHAASPLRPEHFERWVAIWHESIGELFAGPVADEARRRAAIIAQTMQYHLRILDPATAVRG
jgi:hemoglobin